MHEINPNHKEEKPRGFQGVPPIFPKEVKSTSSIRTERARASKDHITSKEERSLECLSPSEAASVWPPTSWTTHLGTDPDQSRDNYQLHNRLIFIIIIRLVLVRRLTFYLLYPQVYPLKLKRDLETCTITKMH